MDEKLVCVKTLLMNENRLCVKNTFNEWEACVCKTLLMNKKLVFVKTLLMNGKLLCLKRI